MKRAERVALCGVAGIHALQWAWVAGVPGLADLYILDSRVYDEMATAFLASGWFGGDEAFRQAPLYPLLLAGLRGVGLGDPLWPLALQVVLGVVNAALVGAVARRTFGPESALPAMLLYGFYAPAAMLETKLMATTLGVTLLLVSISILVASEASSRRSHWFAAGAVLAAACLVRPNALLFAPLAAAYVVMRTGGLADRRAWGRGALFVAAMVLLIAPVGIRNYVVSGTPVLMTAHGGMTLYQSNNPRATGVYSTIPGATGNPRVLAKQLQAKLEVERGRSVSLIEVDRHYRDRAFSFLREDPVRAFQLVLRKLRFWLGNDEISTEYSLANERQLTPTLWLFPVPFALVLGLAVFGGLECWRLKRASWQAGLLFAFLLSNLATVLIFHFSSRYRVPGVAILSMWAGFGVSRGVAAWANRRGNHAGSEKPGGQAVVAACVVMLMSFTPVSRDAERFEALQWFNYGLVFSERGDAAAAVESLERADATLVGDWRVQLALARAYEETGRIDDALARYRRVQELRPGSDAVARIRELETRLEAEKRE